jgi:hypothetical protein
MHAILYDGPKPAAVTFADHKLPALQKKYGNLLHVLSGDLPQQPAAVGISKPTLGKLEGLGPVPGTKPPRDKKPPREKKEKPPKVLKGKPPVHPLKGITPANAKAVVNITTGEYYPSELVAAKAFGVHLSTVGK